MVQCYYVVILYISLRRISETENNSRRPAMSDTNMDTKRLIADSLKELSKEKSFDKISVGEIAARSNVNRQTFYYHFQDKYDLLKWTYRVDYYEPNMTNISMDNWDRCLEGILTGVWKDREFSINTIKHAAGDMRQMILQDAQDIFNAAIDYLRAQPSMDSREIRHMNPEEQRLLARFFAYGICGMLIEWIELGMQEEPSVIAGRMLKLMTICKQLAYQQVMGEHDGEKV